MLFTVKSFFIFVFGLLHSGSMSFIIPQMTELTSRDEGLQRYMISKITKVKSPFWMAFHDFNTSINGANWYKRAWNEHTFDGVEFIDHVLDIIPCQPRSWVIQIGAHLGIFPQQGVARGCLGLSVEGSKEHIQAIQFTAAINNHQNKHFIVHAAGGEKDGDIYFVADKVYHNIKDIKYTSKTIIQHVKMITIDSLISNYIKPLDIINTLIIDVEGYENEVLLGANKTIASGIVKFFHIEVWLVKDGVRVTEFPGLALLEHYGYTIYIGRTYSILQSVKYKYPKPLRSIILSHNLRLLNRICKTGFEIHPKWCLFEVYALHPTVDSTDIFRW
eukprot:gene12822-27035_t